MDEDRKKKYHEIWGKMSVGKDLLVDKLEEVPDSYAIRASSDYYGEKHTLIVCPHIFFFYRQLLPIKMVEYTATISIHCDVCFKEFKIKLGIN